MRGRGRRAVRGVQAGVAASQVRAFDENVPDQSARHERQRSATSVSTATNMASATSTSMTIGAVRNGKSMTQKSVATALTCERRGVP